MVKVQNIAEITPNLPFSEFNFYDLYRSTFEKSELWEVYMDSIKAFDSPEYHEIKLNKVNSNLISGIDSLDYVR